MSQAINVTYEPQELQALTQLLDIALKASGLQVAEVVMLLHKKHVAAVESIQQAQPMRLVQADATNTQEG